MASGLSEPVVTPDPANHQQRPESLALVKPPNRRLGSPLAEELALLTEATARVSAAQKWLPSVRLLRRLPSCRSQGACCNKGDCKPKIESENTDV